MEWLLNGVLEEFEVASEEELLNSYGTADFYKKAKEGVFSYDELICLGYLTVEDVVETLGTEKALSEGVISKEEAKQIEKEGIISAVNLDMANISEDRSIKNFLISAIQVIEKTVGLTEIDSEETVVNMALVYLFNTFDIGLALDSSEILKDRTKFLKDLEAVAKAIEKK